MSESSVKGTWPASSDRTRQNTFQVKFQSNHHELAWSKSRRPGEPVSTVSPSHAGRLLPCRRSCGRVRLLHEGCCQCKTTIPLQCRVPSDVPTEFLFGTRTLRGRRSVACPELHSNANHWIRQRQFAVSSLLTDINHRPHSSARVAANRCTRPTGSKLLVTDRRSSCAPAVVCRAEGPGLLSRHANTGQQCARSRQSSCVECWCWPPDVKQIARYMSDI